MISNAVNNTGDRQLAMNVVTNILNNKYFYLYIPLIPVLIGVIGFLSLLQSPYTGLSFELRGDRYYVKYIDNNSPAKVYASITGKEVRSINGYKIEYKALSSELDDMTNPIEYSHFWIDKKYFAQNIHIGQPLTIQLRDADSITITPVRFPLLEAIKRVALLYIIAILHLLIAIFIIQKRFNDIRVRTIFLVLIFTSWSLFVFGTNLHRDIAFNYQILYAFEILANIVPLFAYALLSHFVLVFPHRHSWSRNKLFLFLIYTLPVLIFLLIEPRIWYQAMFVYLLVSGLFCLFVLTYTYITITQPIEKAQTKWVIGSLIICLIVSTIIYLPVLIWSKDLFFSFLLPVCSILVPLSVVFAIMRYKLMDIDSLFDNTIIYSITIGLLALIDIAIVYTLTSHRIPLLQFSTPVSTIIAVWVIIFAYLPIRNLVQKQIKKILKREIYDINTVSIELAKELLSVSDTQSVFDKAIAVINSALYPKGNSVLLSQHGSIAIENNWLNTEQLNAVKSPTHLYQIDNIDTLPTNYAGGICVPIIGTQRSLGYLVLQDKHSGRLYDKEDIKLLSIISAQLAMAIETIMAREDKEREKEKISREIHDGLGSTFSKAKLLIRNLGNNTATLEELENTIDDGLQDMRELLWAVEKEENTLNDVVFYVREQMKHLKNILSIEILTDMDDDSISLSPITKLNIVRIVQEAVTNTIKHAQATKINISFIRHDNRLTVRITDNGRGFDTKLTTHKHYGLRNMKKRCAEIGGELGVVSTPGAGTEISAIIKL